MARPRRDAEGPTARERLAAAFWEELEETPFERMTARGIAARAGVNHNTFYRHFDGMEDMAAALFDDIVLADVPALILGAAEEGTLPEAAASIKPDPESLRRAMLFARSGSGLLSSMLREKLAAAWLGALGIDPASLTTQQRAICDVVFGGIVTAMGDPALEPTPAFLGLAMASPLGQSMAVALLDMGRTRLP